MRDHWLIMVYDWELDQWVIRGDRGKVIFYRGDWMTLRIDNNGTRCYMERDFDWYIVMACAKLYLRKKEFYQVKI